MPDIKSNEREFMSQVTSWLNKFLKEGSYPFEVASSEPMTINRQTHWYNRYLRK